MTEFIIREAVVADALGRARVHVETWQHAYRGQMPDALLDGLSVEHRAEGHTQRLSNPARRSHSLVAAVDDTILGFCDVGASREPDADEQDGELYALYVHPGAMGKSVGSALIDEGVRQLRAEGFTRATLWVLTTNTRARQFYERKGWSADGVSKSETWDGFELAEVRYTINLAQ